MIFGVVGMAVAIGLLAVGQRGKYAELREK
jgi:hypothetical protein